MSWPLWNQGYAQPQPQQPQMTGAYTAEQWAAMQQQNWQQWGQWQQYSQWQQPPPPQTPQANYSAKIGDSAVAQPPLPPPPEVAPPPPPPPPHENNLPLFNNKPNVKQNNFNNAQNLQKPPVLNAQQPPVQNIAQTNKQSYSNTYRSYRNDQGYGDRNDKVHGDENNQGYGDENDQEYKVDEDPGYGDWSDRGHGNQDDRGYNVQKEQYQSKDQDRNKTFGNQPWNQQNDRRGEYQNRDRGTDYRGNYNDRGNSRNAVHGPFNDQIPQKRTRYDDEYDSGRQSTNDSKWNAPSRTDTPVRNTNEPPPSANEKTDEERDFDVQFEKWELEFQKWKEQNANHPDKVAYREYEQKFETCRVQLLERRRQMLLKRTMKTNVSAPVAAAVSQPEEALPSPNNDNGDNWQDYNDYLPPDDEDDNGGLFPSADKSKGIPGLDLVESNSKDDNESPKDNNDDDVIVVNEKIIIDDDNDNSVVSVDDMKKDTAPARMLTLPENLNSILGNRSLMDALSMVKQSGAIQSKPVPSIPAIPSLMSNLIQAPVSVSNSNLKMNVLVSSDQPPQLERPVQPAQPVRPFQPSQQAVRPFQPGQQPVRPFQPAQPVRLNQLPQQPGQPFQPARQPVRPFQSAHQPFQHAQPVRPNQPPQQAVRPFQSAHQPFQPAQPVRPNQSTQQPIQPFQPARPVRPFQSAHPGQLFQPAQPVQTARPVRPMQPRFPQPQQNRYAQPQVQLQQRPALNPQLLNPQLQAAAQLAAQQLNLPGLNLLGIQTQLQTLLGNQQLASLLGAVSHQAVGTAISPANQDQKPPQVPVKPNNGSQQKSNLYDMTPVELAAAAESSKPTWSEESVVEPHVMVDYNHKSTKSAATDFFEPAQTFDYDHLSKTNQELAKPVDDTWRDIDDYHKRTGVKVIDYQNKSLREPTAERRGRPEERWGGEERRRGPRREERDTRERRSSRERERERRPSRERRRSLERYRRSSRERGRDESRERRNFLDRVYSKDRRSPREREQKPEDIQRVENQQPPFPVTEPANETIVVLDDPPSHFDEPLEDVQPQVHRHLEQKIVMIDDILEEPGRNMRPEKIVIIMRGLPGSGKTYLAKLIKDREIENGGSAPRALSIDDYFLTEVDNFITDPNTGKKVKITNQKYEFDAANELAYLKSLHKAFKRTISDGYFNFVIFDCNNEIISDILECANVAKQANFQVYICEMENDVSACHKRNIHERSLEDIEQIYSRWQRLPNSLVKLDCTTLLQNAAIDDVDMEDALDDEDLPEVEEQAEKEEEVPRLFASKWDRTDDIDKLARLDGTSKPLRSTAGTMEDYLQLDDWQAQKTAQPGKKTVRWADIEERREQEKMRAIGFVVGQTNWDRMTDPTQGSAALTQTKYIERVGRY